MFCMNCGSQLPNNAKFCFQCGQPLQSAQQQPTQPQMRPAQQMQQPLQPQQPMRSQQYAGQMQQQQPQQPTMRQQSIRQILQQRVMQQQAGQQPIQQAVQPEANAYGQPEGSVDATQAASADNLLRRAKEFEKNGKFDLAVEYFNKVLDIDFRNSDARDGIERIKQAKKEYIYLEIPADSALMEHGVLRLKKGKLIFKSGADKIMEYNVERISKIRATMGYIGFIYEDRGWEITYGTNATDAKNMMKMVLDAQQGIYPEMRF